MTLSDDDVRERFSAFHDGELPEPEAAAMRKRLDDSPALAAEYDKFRAMLGGLGTLGVDVSAEMKPGVAPPAERVDLLAGVQERLHKRSAGRFYRTRWARAAGVVPLEAIALVVLVLLLVAYVCMTYISGLRPAGEGAPTPSTTTPRR